MKNENGLRAATWRSDKALYITQAGIIAAIYVVLTVVFAPFAFKEVQVRSAEALTILPFFFPAAVPGVFIGCIIGNILGGAVLPDIVFGSLATLIGALGTYYVGIVYRKRKEYRTGNSLGFTGNGKYATSPFEQGSRSNSGGNPLIKYLIIAAIPPIIANAIIVPFVLRYAYGVPMAIPLMMLTVGAGEIISCGILGVLLGRAVS
ncbi:MAG: QueT transporter family protein [Firmicutes bacterium]|nr:QueT transporter family protein [Bacillota bacterium]